MKRNKLLFMTPCVALATIAPICACSQTNQAQDIVDAIFGPLDLKKQKINSFETELKKLSPEELNNELVYDLFGLYGANFSAVESELLVEKMKHFYEDGTIQIKTNITKKSLIFDKDNKLHATFLGYVSFVFIKDFTFYEYDFKANDYIMLTYDLYNLPVNIMEKTCSLMYFDDSFCIGFMKLRYDGGTSEHLQAIESIYVGSDQVTVPHNSKNWIKAA